jgi:multiple sugar transport system substrate-binding protein/sn-glycerol 3-phosphate transport system substrate-binding protein
MNIRKLLPNAFIAVMLLAACGPQAAPSAPSPADAPAAPAATAAPAAAPAASGASAVAGVVTADDIDKIVLSKDKPTEVVFWHRYSGGQVTAVLEIINDFNATNPYGVVVKLEKAGESYDDVYNKINSALQGGGVPALSIAYQNQAAFYRREGAVINLAPYIASKKYGLSAEELADFYQLFLDSDKNPQYPGEVLGWPTNRSMEVLYTNLDWLKNLGVNEPPKTLKEFEELACKATDKSKEQYGFILNPNDASRFASFVFAFGGDVIRPDASGYAFNSDAGVQAMTLLQRMFKNGCAVELPAAERFGDQSRFAAGKVLFVTASSTGLPFYASAVGKAEKPFKWTISLFPQADSAKPKTNLYGASWSMFKTTPEQQLGAWLFMKFFTEPAQSQKWSKASNYVAVRKSAAAKAIADVKGAKTFATFPEAAAGYESLYGMFQYGTVEAAVAGYDPVRKLMQDAMKKVAVTGEGDVKAALDDAVAKGDELLAENAPSK